MYRSDLSSTLVARVPGKSRHSLEDAEHPSRKIRSDKKKTFRSRQAIAHPIVAARTTKHSNTSNRDRRKKMKSNFLEPRGTKNKGTGKDCAVWNWIPGTRSPWWVDRRTPWCARARSCFGFPRRIYSLDLDTITVADLLCRFHCSSCTVAWVL